MTLKEINERLIQLRSEISMPDSDLVAIEKEIDKLTEEKRELNAKLEKRQKLIDKALTINANEEEKTERKESKNMEMNYRSVFFKNLQGHELNIEERALLGTSAVIPTETLNRVVERLEEHSVLLPFITRLSIPGNVTLPVENVKNEASWVAMGGASTDSADSFAAVALTAHKLIKTVEIGADVAAMAIDAFESFIVDALAKKLARAIENAILNGTGSLQPTGLLLTGQVTQIETWTATGMTYADLLKVPARLPSPYHRGARWVFNRATFFQTVLAIVDTTGRPVVLREVEGGSGFLLLGYPVVINDFVPANQAIFGNFEYYALNFAKAFEISKDSSVAFRVGSQVYRALALVDARPTMAEAFVRFNRA